jgi:hypothetical protein
MNITEYLAHHIAADAQASIRVSSLINERGYEAQAADRLHEWVDGHMMVILSQPVVSNPYQEPWPTWMKDILTASLQQVDWTELVNSLRKEPGPTQA